VPDDQLMDEVYAMARKIAAGPPLAQQAIKRSFQKSFEIPWQTLGEYQQAIGDVLWETDDHMEGVRSFMEKRDPVFKGRRTGSTGRRSGPARRARSAAPPDPRHR